MCGKAARCAAPLHTARWSSHPPRATHWNHRQQRACCSPRHVALGAAACGTCGCSTAAFAMVSRELLPLSEEKRPLVGTSQERPNERQITSRSVALVAASIVGALLVVSGMVRGSQSLGSSHMHKAYDDPRLEAVKRDNERLMQQIDELTNRKAARDSADLQQLARIEALKRELATPLTPPVSSSPPAGAAVPPAPVRSNGAPDYRLSVARIKAHCDSHNIILITFVNSKRANYAYTWASHLMRLRLTNYMVGAMDGEALVKLTR